MWPSLREGDLAVCQRAPRVLETGNVLVVRNGGRFIVHRLVGFAGEKLVLRGDTCELDDPPVPRSAILGVVCAVRRNGRRLAHWDVGPRWLGKRYRQGIRTLSALKRRWMP
jgi:hypothetical protein